jgi:hypothetical protein
MAEEEWLKKMKKRNGGTETERRERGERRKGSDED